MGEVDENDKVVGGGPSRKRKADGEAESSSDEDDGGLVDMASESRVDRRAAAGTLPGGFTGTRVGPSSEVGYRRVYAHPLQALLWSGLPGHGGLVHDCMSTWVLRGGWHQRAC